MKAFPWLENALFVQIPLTRIIGSQFDTDACRSSCLADRIRKRKPRVVRLAARRIPRAWCRPVQAVSSSRGGDREGSHDRMWSIIGRHIHGFTLELLSPHHLLEE
jgi:hypothetical protein